MARRPEQRRGSDVGGALADHEREKKLSTRKVTTKEEKSRMESPWRRCSAEDDVEGRLREIGEDSNTIIADIRS